MKDKRKIIILGSGITCILILIVGIFIFYFHREDEKKAISDILYNENANFLKEQHVEGFLFEHIQCQFNGKVSLISYDIINQTEQEVSLLAYEIVIKDKDDQIITVLEPNIEQVLPPNEKISIQNEVNVDLTKATSMEIQWKEKEA